MVAEVGGHPAAEGDDIGGMSHFDFRFGILDFRLRGVEVILGESGRSAIEGSYMLYEKVKKRWRYVRH